MATDSIGPGNVDWSKIDLPLRLEFAGALTPAEAGALIAPAVAEWQGRDAGIVRRLRAWVESVGPAIDARWFQSDSPWRQSVAGRWLLADAATRAGEKVAALTRWDEVVADRGPGLAEALLARARLRQDLGQIDAAYADLRTAAASSRDFSLLTKLARFQARLEKAGPSLGRPVKIALLFSSTTDLLTPLLQLACAREGLAAQIYAAPFGTFEQELRDERSAFHRFAPEFVVVGTHWRDAHLPAVGAEGAADAGERLWAEVSGRWRAILSRHACTILQHGFDLPAIESGAYLAAGEAAGRQRILREFNARLWREKPPAVVVVDLERLAAISAPALWEDATQWHVAKLHPSSAAMPYLVDRYVALIRARLGLTKKVLVLDLDNTIWGGVMGEDGLAGIEIGPPGAVGEAHAALQSYAKELKERGVLLAVCSKNNDADARAPFRERDGMILKEEDFVLFVANWREKAENLREMASALSLGLDSFVLVDDDPVERARVREQLPQVAVVELGTDPAEYVARLDATGWFEAVSLSGDDRARHASYQANAAREEVRANADNLGEFLAKLAMRMHHGPFDDRVLERVVQLLGKTNQFNLTTRRHSLEQVRRLMARSDGWTRYFRLSDVYGDNGIIGVAIAIPDVAHPEVWEIDTLLMSCRVVGRQAEDFMLATLLHAARARGIAVVRGFYLPTPKNGLAAEVLPRFGFAPAGSYQGTGYAYEWDVRARKIPAITAIVGVPVAE